MQIWMRGGGARAAQDAEGEAGGEAGGEGGGRCAEGGRGGGRGGKQGAWRQEGREWRASIFSIVDFFPGAYGGQARSCLCREERDSFSPKP